MPIALQPVRDLDFAEFTHAFNAAYSDYYVPIAMTVPGFRALFERDDIAPDASVAAIDDGRIVGTGLLGIRGGAAWIGGMGVIPSRRREGIGREMMRYLIAQAGERSLTHIDLEVIEENYGAYALYRELGFEDQRHLLMLERDSGSVITVLPDCPLEQVSPEDALDFYDAFHPIANCWQRARPSLEGMTEHLQAWGYNNGDGLAGYALGYADDTGIRLLDLAAAPAPDAARSAGCLLAALHRRYPRAYASFYNVASNDPVLPAFEALGYSVTFRQIEMRLAL